MWMVAPANGGVSVPVKVSGTPVGQVSVRLEATGCTGTVQGDDAAIAPATDVQRPRTLHVPASRATMLPWSIPLASPPGMTVRPPEGAANSMPPCPSVRTGSIDPVASNAVPTTAAAGQTTWMAGRTSATVNVQEALA